MALTASTSWGVRISVSLASYTLITKRHLLYPKHLSVRGACTSCLQIPNPLGGKCKQCIQKPKQYAGKFYFTYEEPSSKEGTFPAALQWVPVWTAGSSLLDLILELRAYGVCKRQGAETNQCFPAKPQK